jgi:thiamine-phosphate pyrophosphorylase
MTDERQSDAIWLALEQIPRGSGIVFRHYSLPPARRRALFARVWRIARRRRLVLVLAGEKRTARVWQADGRHGGNQRRAHLLQTISVHNLREIREAERYGADLLFLSPVFPTRSHPGARPLGRCRFGLLARSTKLPVVALGGMDADRARHVPNAYGWAAIDAWSRTAAQKRKAVPR